MNHGRYHELALSNMAWESFGGESIIIDFVTGSYFSLSSSASDIVKLAAAGHSVEGVVDTLAARYDTTADTVRSDVLGLLDRASEVGVLRARSSAGEPGDAELQPPTAEYTPPLLDKYDDMEEMLLLDPIHDLDETGWPRAQAAPPQPPARP